MSAIEHTKKALPLEGGGLGGGVRRPSRLNHSAARHLRRTMTDAEKKLWQAIRNEQLGIKFRRQQPIGPYIVDFVAFDVRLVVELDGGQHTEKKDAVRTAFLQQEGYSIVRFWNHEVMENLSGAFDVVSLRIGFHPHPASPLEGEEKESA